MKKFSKYIGLDVHKETIAVAVAEADVGEVRFFGEIVNTPEAIQKLVGQLIKAGAQLSFCYEAGPCG
jgi:transposase